MARELLSINDFSQWMVNDTTAQWSKWFADMSWVDIWTEDWVAQINKRLEQDTTTSMTSDPLSNATFDGKIISWNSDEEIWYNNTWTTWTLLHTNSNSWDNDDIIVYQNYLIYASNDRLGRSTWTTIGWWFTDSPTWWSGSTFSNWSATDTHFFKIFNNRLYVSDWNFLAELDWASDPSTPWNWVFEPEAFTLPEWEKIVSMEVIWSELGLWTEWWNFYLWDWASDNASQIIKTSLWGITAMIQLENTLFVFAWLNWTIYRYNGADFKPVFRVPNVNISTSSFVRKPAVRKYKNWFIFWLTKNGIYVINRADETKPLAMNKYWPFSWWQQVDEFDPVIFSIYIINQASSEDEFIVWYRYNLVEKIDRVNTNKRYRLEEAWSWDTSVSPYIDTIEYQLRDANGKPNKVQWVQWFFRDTSISSIDRNNIQVEYKFNTDQNFTVLWMIWNEWIDINKILRWINKRVHKITFRIRMWWEFSSTNDNTKLIWLKIF